MFARIFGSKSSIPSAPLKDHIEVVCPSCGAAQYEPRLVVSTSCKKCGAHLTVQKSHVIASSTEVSHPSKDPPPSNPAREAANPLPRRRAGTNAMGKSATSPPSGSGTLREMKEHSLHRSKYFKDIQCFECGHEIKIGRSAKTANCPACGAGISIEDVEINMASTQSIKTRGNVIIRKRGHLSTRSVQCRDLNCQGIIEANITCNGDATFRTTGNIIGEIRCQRLIIEKTADVTFLKPVFAADVEIHARVTGTIFSSGPVLITSNGAINGDVIAGSVSIESGGQLNGTINIVRSKRVKRPAPPAT